MRYFSLHFLQLVLALCFIHNSLWAATFMLQDFEDTIVFPIDESFGLEGVGNGLEYSGLWQSYLADDGLSPKVINENSTFSDGSQCVEIMKSFMTGSGVLLGCRTNSALTEHFNVEFAYKAQGQVPDDQSVELIVLLVSDECQEINIGFAFSGGIASVAGNGTWHGKTSRPKADGWYRVKFVGNIKTGLYDVYMDFGSENNWRGWQVIAQDIEFDNDQLSEIDGIYAESSKQDQSLYIDDILFTGDIYEPTNCTEALTSGTLIQGDLTGDCTVAFEDFLLLAQNWLHCAEFFADCPY
jgi:hypothetical protein